jgi:hypothetical protein
MREILILDFGRHLGQKMQLVSDFFGQWFLFVRSSIMPAKKKRNQVKWQNSNKFPCLPTLPMVHALRYAV